MPTKALLYAAEVLHLTRHAEPWGIRTEEASFNFAQVMARKNALIKDFADCREQQLRCGKFKFIRAMARFADAHTLELDSGDKLTAGSFVIATGSSLAPSPLPQLDDLDCLNSDTALKLTCLPKSLIILGGGAVAVEFAQFFARFGVRVTLIQRSPHILHEFDEDAAAELEKVFQREGITLYTGTRLVDARKTGGSKEIVFEHNRKTVRVHAEEVFFALGRRPNISSLALDKVGVQVEYERIRTDSHTQTNVPHIYAVGDCAGLHEIVHIAIQQGEIAAFNIAHPGQKKQMDYRLLTEVIFTEPQIAVVGLTEQRAHVRNITYEVAKYPFCEHGKSLIMEAKDGFVKLLADPITGEIIGGCCVGPVGGELIHEIIAAMQKRMTVHELASMPHYHPTLAEIWAYPAEELAERIRK
jgi:pyruvate/2-oxoglutarate dehydrogenase complex dihydrolipoamide dehydrogenase (E3) component